MSECIFRETTNPNEKGFLGTEGTLIITKIDSKNYFVFNSRDGLISITHEIVSNINDLKRLDCNEAWYQDNEGYEYKFYCTPEQQMRKNTNINNNYIMPQEEKSNKWLAAISFFIPIVGLVLYLTQKSEKPKTAKACGKCALVSAVINFIAVIIITLVPVLDTYISEVNEKEATTYSEKNQEDNYEDYNLSEEKKSTLPNINNEEDNNIDNDNSNTKETSTLGGKRQGYIKASGETWGNFKDLDYASEEMLQFTNGSEIITMAYYDGTNSSKIDVLNSITLAVQNASQRNSNALYLQTDKFLFDDFYAETIYTVDHPDYKCFGMYFQSDKTHDMLFFSIESPNLSDSEFEKLVNEIINSHSFVSHKLEFKINK